jgi:hypothetical protein
MTNKLSIGVLIILFIGVFITACDNMSTNTNTLEESLDLYTNLDPIEEASNTTVTINKGSDLAADGYFEVNISNVQANELIDTGTYGAWCIEWEKPLRSSNDEHTGVKLYTTGNQSKWRPLSYFFAIKNELKKEDPSLTYREFQAAIWAIAGDMGVAPKFDLDELSISEVPDRLKSNGKLIVDKEKVRTIVNRVRTNYKDAEFELPGGADGLIIAETEGDEQDVVLEPVARITLTPSPLSLAVNEMRQMTARAFDEDGDQITDAEFEWSIDDESIATVDQNGMVTGVMVGTTTVRVESGGEVATATVVVTAIVDNFGNEFIIGLLPNTIDGPPITEVHLSSAVEAEVTVQYPMNNPTFTETVSVSPGSVSIVSLPSTSSSAWSPGSPDQDNAIRATSDQDFVMYAVNVLTFTSDAALGLPSSVLGTDYIVTNYTALFYGLFSVVATENNTEVEITPTQDLVGGYSANTPFTITLDRGEGFLGQAMSRGVAGDLTGTTISASSPVAVTNGNYCANVPTNAAACDHMFEVAHPTNSWTNETVAAPLPNRPNGSTYRIIARDDNTTIERNGSVEATLNAGEFYETSVVAGPQRFTANNPIFATQLMTGVTSPGAILGDPAMGNLIPTEQFLSSYTFSTVGGNLFSENWLNIVAHNDDISAGSVLLDGSAISAGSFSPIPGTDFSYAQIQLSEGSHTTSSSIQPHGIYVIGFNPANSYIYPGGAGISDL